MEVAVQQLQTFIETQPELVTDLTNKLIAAVSAGETRTYMDVASTSREEAFPGLSHQTQHGQKGKAAIVCTGPPEKGQHGNTAQVLSY